MSSSLENISKTLRGNMFFVVKDKDFINYLGREWTTSQYKDSYTRESLSFSSLNSNGNI